MRLHTRIDGGVNFESVFVKIIRFAVGLAVIFAPREHVLTQVFAKISGKAVLMILLRKVGHINRHHLARIVNFLRNEIGFEHLMQHHVAPLHGVFGVAHGVVVRGGFEHAHQHRRFVQS